MSKEFRALSKLTKTVPAVNDTLKLNQWLAEGSRTYGWGAILAYDRQSANKVLKQEYIQRFNSASVALPISLSVSGGAETKQLSGYEFDAPLMSFENHTDGDVSNDPRCKLRLPIIAGSYKTVAAKGIVTSISVLDPLDGQVLTMTLDLMARKGAVNDKDQVVFDISEGTGFTVDVNEHSMDQEDVGKAIQAYFKEKLPLDQKVWVLSTIDKSKNQYLKPASIVLYVRQLPGSTGIADGELLVLVAMQGDLVGTALPADFPYLTSRDSAIIMLGQKTLLEKVVHPQLSSFYSSMTSTAVKEENDYVLKTLSGSADVQHKSYNYVTESEGATLPVTIAYQTLEFAGEGNQLKVTAAGEYITAAWSGQNTVDISAGYFNNWGSQWVGTLAQTWAGSSKASYKVKADGSGLEVSSVMDNEPSRSETIKCTSIPAATDALNDVMNRLCIKYKSEYVPEMIGKIKAATHNALAGLPELNTFVLESILFRNEDSVSLNSCSLPNDLVMQGTVGHSFSAYEITPMAHIMPVGTTHQFRVEPATVTDVVWSVESVSGDGTLKGTIDTSTGLYTPPDLSGFKGDFIRERVVAKKGNYVSYALVSVLKKTITVNPLLTVKTIGKTPIEGDNVSFSANHVSGASLSWELIGPGQGGLQDKIGYSNVYTPNYTDSTSPYDIDSVSVTDESGNQVVATVIVNRTADAGAAMVEGSSTATTVQLEWVTGGADIIAEAATTLTVVGSGTIDAKGLYTQSENNSDTFAIVKCKYASGPFTFSSFIVIPLPLVAYAAP